MGFFRSIGKGFSNVVRGSVSIGRDVAHNYASTQRMILRNPYLPTAVGAMAGVPVPPNFPPNIDPALLGNAQPLYGQGGGFAQGFAGGGWLGGVAKDVLTGAGGKILGDVVMGGFGGASGYGTGGGVPVQTSGGGAAAGTIINMASGKGIFPALPDDINSLVALRNAGFTLRAADLIHVPRSPNKNFVVVRPWNDARYIGMRRDLAIKMGLFKPGKKPIISVKQSNALRTANSAINALKRANKQAVKIANFRPGGARRPALPPPPKKGR